MSYVVQNFYEANKKIILTPRFKAFFFLMHLKKFIIFIKLNVFFSYTKIFNIFKLNHFFIFFKHFFSNQFFKILYKNHIFSVSNFDNNLIKSYSFNFYYLINQNFNNNFIKFNIDPFAFKTVFLYNNYLLPIKIINIKLNKNFFKNIFFFFFIHNFFLWIQIDNKFKFYLNFIFIIYNWKISRFYNTHFLRIYNH